MKCTFKLGVDRRRLFEAEAEAETKTEGEKASAFGRRPKPKLLNCTIFRFKQFFYIIDFKKYTTLH